jgi:hypothetical protein
VWDCAAGTGNLLAGLTNPYNVWASDIDQSNVDTMLALADIDEVTTLLSAHIFQFDFLNDSFDKLPEGLRNIIDDSEKRKKLIVYINPPYAEATSATTAAGTGHNKENVAIVHKTRDEYKDVIGAATNELFAQFMAHIYHKIPNSKMASFSTLKFIGSQHFITFREFFKATFKDGFVIRADTFDNAHGKFPIGFTVWDLAGEKFPESIELDIIEKGGKKKYWAGTGQSINKWIKQFNNEVIEGFSYMANPAPDFQNINQPYVTAVKGGRHFHYYVFNADNILEGCIYFAVRLCIEHTWLNNQDQFLYPNDGYKTDMEFQNNCLVFALFHGKNYISSNDGINHWIPFTEEQVGAKGKFESNFMSNFLKGRAQITPLNAEAQSVYNSGLALWKYYHAKTKNGKAASVNASFYDIREYFQGRRLQKGGSDKGTMNSKSTAETYTQLLDALRDALKTLTQKIQPKVYEYGFLRE